MIDQFNLTDTGNAKRLVHTHGKNIVYCPDMERWYIFNEEIWEPDITGQMYQLAKLTATQFHRKAINVDDEHARKTLVRHALKMESQISLKNLVESAQNEQGIPININDFDKNKDIICVKNGTLDLQTGELFGFVKDEFITKQINVRYEPNAEANRFTQFMEQVIPDKEIRDFLQRFFGYCLTGHTSEQVFCIFYGHGSNGKGTMINTIMDVMGVYSKTTEPDSIIQKKYERTSTNDLADLRGARFVTTSENQAYQVLDEGRIKRITGQDKLKCRFLYKEFFEYIPEFKLVLLTNHEPIIKAQDYSIWRRVLKVPFDVTIPKEEWDLHLRDKLAAEYEGILSWLVDGALDWYTHGLMVPDAIKASTDEYKEELDQLGDFIDIYCVVDASKEIQHKDLYIVYKSWCLVSNISSKSSNSFSRELNERSFKSSKKNGIRYKVGIDLDEQLKIEYELVKNIDDEKTLLGSIGSILEVFLESPYRKNIYRLSETEPKTDPIDPEPSTDNGSKNINRPRPRNKEPSPCSIPIIKTGFGVCDKCNKEFLLSDLDSGPAGLKLICKPCQLQLVNKRDEQFKTNQNNNSELVKIKLLIPKSNFTIDGKEYNLQCNDVAEVPRGRAEKMIIMNIASRVGIS